MKDNLRRMNRLIKIFGIDSFYRIEFDSKEVIAFVACNHVGFDFEKAVNLFDFATMEDGIRKFIGRNHYRIILN